MMKFKSIFLVLLFAFLASGLSLQPASALVADVIVVDDIENVVISDPPEVIIPICPVAVVVGDPDAAVNFCAGLAKQVNELIAKNNELKTQLADLRTQINIAAAEMQKVLTKASRVLKRLNGCYGIMQGTRSCAGPGYQPGDWTNHNPNGVFDDMEDARDELLDLRTDISAQERAADARIRALNDLLEDIANCDDKTDADAIQKALAALSAATDEGFKELAAIKAAAVAAVNDFNTAYNSFKAKITDFLAKTQAVITDNAPNSIRNIARSCGMSRRAAARERRRRGKVIRCLKKLQKEFDKLP